MLTSGYGGANFGKGPLGTMLTCLAVPITFIAISISVGHSTDEQISCTDIVTACWRFVSNFCCWCAGGIANIHTYITASAPFTATYHHLFVVIATAGDGTARVT